MATPRSTFQATLQIGFKGARYEIEVPVAWSRSDTELSASSDFVVTHGALNLTPFAILGGGIAVADEIEVSLRLTARLATSPEGGWAANRKRKGYGNVSTDCRMGCSGRT